MAINKGWFNPKGTDELQAVYNGSERLAINATGISVHGVTPAAQSATIADVSVSGSYATDDTPIETAINALIAALVAHGIVAAA